MSNTARQQLGLQAEKLRIKTKNEHLPLHDLCLGQNVMMQDPTSKKWSPVVITKLCQESRSYQVITKDGVTYRKMQVHLKPYKSDDKQESSSKTRPYVDTSKKTLIKTLIMIIWHSQELEGKFKPPVKLDL